MSFIRKDKDSVLDAQVINSIEIDGENEKIYIGTDNGLYLGDHSGLTSEYDENFHRFINGNKVVDTKFLSSGYTLVIGAEALYEKNVSYGLVELSNMSEKTTAYKRIKNNYVISNRGLFIINDCELNRVSTYGTKQIYDVETVDNSLSLVSVSDGLYKNGEKFDDALTTETLLSKYRNVILLANGDKLFYVRKDRVGTKEEYLEWRG